MITVKISNDGESTHVRFPCRETELEAKLEEIGAYGRQNAPHFYIEDVTEPAELAELKGRNINLDELNYFAKRLEGFVTKEKRQFYAAMKSEHSWDMKGLINLAFNLAHYTLIQDVSSMEAVGRIHLLNVNGGLSAEELEEKEWMAEEGKALLSSGRGIATDYGLVFKNETVPFQEIYDGGVFPDYDYTGTALICAEVDYKGFRETLYLPDDELALKKSLARLGAETFEECAIGLDRVCLGSESWMQRVQDVINSEGLYEANHMLEAMQRVESQLDKLGAAVNYADVEGSAQIVALARNLDEFVYVKYAEDHADVGRYWTEHYAEYALNKTLEDYFDYGAFGDDLVNDRCGTFVRGGYICMAGNRELADILGETEDESMTMGGM